MQNIIQSSSNYYNTPTKYITAAIEHADNFKASNQILRYTNRNNIPINKAYQDIMRGKLAEYITAHHLHKYYNKELILPDITVYPEHHIKTYYAPDIIHNNLNIHVKSHTINKYYEESYIFQKSDPLIINPKNNDYISLIIINQKADRYILRALFKAPDIIPHLLSPLKKEYLNQTKTCLYAKDIINYYS